MKKIIIVLILAIAGVASVQAQNEVEQAFIKGFISGMDQELVSLNEDGMRYNGTFLEGKNIICSVTVDETQFGGMPMKQAFQMVGVDEVSFGQMMREEMFSQKLDAEERSGLQMLKGYGYKIYFRMIGSVSGETMNCRIEYEALLQ